MHTAPLKRASTLFLKLVLLGMAVAALAICVFLFPQIAVVVPREMPGFPRAVGFALVGFFATAIPFLFALFQAWKLLRYIDANTAFSAASVVALRTIKYCAASISVLLAMCVPLAFILADLDDAPGAGAMALAAVCAPLVVATFAAVLQKLVRSAIDLKTENDLTI